jgi:serine/threonine protein kinase
LASCAQCHATLAPGARVCPSCHALVPIASPGAALAPGVTIDRGDSRIVLDARIGEGGMGVIYRAWRFYPPSDPRHEGGPRPLALKVLRGGAHAEPRLREYFQKEAAALAQLSHPNIVRFDELFEHGDAAVLAMELVDGEALDSILSRHARGASRPVPCLPALRALAYLEQLLGALASLHALGIVHRDVKPQNVLVRRDGIVKLTDFGIAKRVAGEGASKAPTDAGVAPGTGAYMSPEQVLGHLVDGRSDLYSAAIVLYEMLAGRPPFPPAGKSELLVRGEQVSEPPPPIRAFFPQLPVAVDAFFSRALAKAPDARFAGAIEMGAALRAAFGLPESEEWRAQAEMARRATSPDTPSPVAMGTLRDIVVQRYRTEPIAIPPPR